MNIHIPEAQQQLMSQLGPVMKKQGFYLAGGTALALYFRHRLSVILDWFTSAPMGDVMSLAGKLQDIVDLTITEIGAGTLHAISNQVRLSFLEYRYPLLEAISFNEQCACPIASLDDIACMKLSAVSQRGSRKDFIDIYTLVNRHRTLSEQLSRYQQKFALGNIATILYALVYFDDAEKEPLPQHWEGDWNELKQSFRKWVKEIT